MTAPIHDGDLISSYARDGEEGAFRAIVARHVDLVFATALRQVGDRGVAEEITQNVFVALSRKAGSLRGYETLAGWLHRTTILEAKARIRSELRRRQREQTAAELAERQNEGASPLAPLVPLLDEALLSLREGDRTALVSRFLEERPLREVGAALGVDEDAARKRVSRALDRLSEFFRARGFALPAGVGVAGLFPLGSQAAPSGLAATVTQAGLTAGVAGGSLTPMLLNFMALSKTKAIVASAVLVSAPLLWQARTEAELASERTSLEQALREQEELLAQLARERDEARERLRRTTAERYATEARIAEFRAVRENQAPPPRYHWDDLSPLARVPKEFLKDLGLSTFHDRSGRLSEHMQEVLQLTPTEAVELQSAVDTYLANVRAAQEQTMRYIPPATPEAERVFEIGDTTEVVRTERAALFSRAAMMLGEERFGIFREGLDNWMPLSPLEDVSRGGSSLEAVTPQAHTVTFRSDGVGLTYEVKSAEPSWFSSSIDLEEVPSIFVPYLQDWIDTIRRKQAVLMADPNPF